MRPRPLFLLAAAVAPWLPLFAEPAAITPVAVSESVEADRVKFPNADTLTLELEQNVEVNADGGYLRRTFTRVKALTEKGRRELLATSVGFNRAYGWAKLLELRVTKPDGRVIELDPAVQSAEQQDPSSAESNIYDPNDRFIAISVPGVEIGDTVSMRIEESEAKPRMKGCFADIVPLEGSDPILRQRYVLNTPASLPPVRIMIKGGDASGIRTERREAGGRVIRTWEVGPAPQMLPEPSMPAQHLCARRLLVSTAPDWKTISRWYWELSKPHFAASPEMKAKAAELVAGVTDREERLRRVFRFVSQEIRYMGVTTETEAPGYEPHDVSITFSKRYGVCRDKAALLVAMLREVGFDAYPVLIMAGANRLDGEVPQPYFNHAITAVREPDGSCRLMDSTNENTKDLFPGYLSNCSYLVADPNGDELRVSPLPDAADHLLRGDTRITVRPDGSASGELVLNFSGITDNAYRAAFAEARPEDVRRMAAERLASALPGVRVESVSLTPERVSDTSKPLALRVSFETQDFMVPRDGKAFVRTPSLASAFDIAAGQIAAATTLEKRRFPLKLGRIAGVSEVVSVTLPPGFGEPLALPDDVSVANEAFTYAASVKRSGDTLTARSDLRVRALDIPVSEYAAMRAGLREIRGAGRKSALYATDAGERPDSRVIRRKVVFEFKDATSCEMRVEERRRILTYAGKKSNAELKISWNAADPEPRLLRAVVRDASGAEHAAGPSEINVLDAEWVAAAPRYTPTRTKVVALPAVTEGAEIETAYAVTRSGLPGVTWQDVFADADRVDAAEVEILAPASLALYFENHADAVVNTGDGRVRITVRRAVAPAPREAGASDPVEWAPSLRISSLRDEGALAASVRAALAGKCEPDAAVRRKATELTAGLVGELPRLRALRDFVAKSIRPAGPAWGEIPPAGFSGAARTLADGYGAEPDRAMLFLALARAAGFEAEPALYASSEYETARLRPGAPLPPGFYATLGARVRLGDGVADFEFLDQYAHSRASVTPGVRVLPLDTGRGEIANDYPGMASAVSDRYEINLAESGGASLRHSRVWSGSFAASPTRRFEEMTPEDRDRMRQESVSALARDATAGAGFRVRGGQPAELAYDATIADFVVTQGRYAYFDLPGAVGEVFRGANASASRRLPYAVRGSENVRRVWEITPPKGWRLAAEIRPLEWKGPAGVGEVSLTVSEFGDSAEGRRIRVAYESRLRPGDVPPAAFPALSELNRRLKSPDTWRILLERE